MTNLLKKSQKAFQEGGFELFFQRTKNYLHEKTSSFFHHLYFISFKTKILKEIKDFQANNINDVWNFINNQLHGLIKPMQIKEEFTELLKIFVEKQPKIILEIGTAFIIEKLEKDNIESLGVFLKAKKPFNFKENDLTNYELYCILEDKRIKNIEENNIEKFQKKILRKEKLKNFYLKLGKSIYYKI